MYFIGTGALDCLLVRRDQLDVNARDKYGRTPLHLACKFGRHVRIGDLIRCGADAQLVDKKLCTPLHYAAQIGDMLVLDTILRVTSKNKELINQPDSFG